MDSSLSSGEFMTTRARWKRSLEYASRSRRFLWTLALLIIAAGVATGWLLHRLRPAPPEQLAERIMASVVVSATDYGSRPDELTGLFLKAFADELAEPLISFAEVVHALPKLAPLLVTDEAKAGEILSSRFSPEQAELAKTFITLSASDPARRAPALERLKNLAEGEPAPRFSNELAGHIESREGRYASAYRHFKKEGERPEAVRSREWAVNALISGKDFAGLSRLSHDPAYASLITARRHLQVAILMKDWRAILAWVPAAQITLFQGEPLVLALIAGFAWAFLLFHLGENRRFLSGGTLLCVIGFLLGVVSTTPTIYAVIWQDDFLQFSAGDNAFRILAYNIGGVGVREELCKLLLFIPLIPVLLKRGDEREVLMVASFVGLGFAIEENGNYLLGSQGMAAPGRFLTANFLHLALTGMNGLALYRAFAHGVAGFNQFMTVLPLTILVHGLYNALPDIAELQDLGGYLSLTLYVVFSMFYFRQASGLRENVRMTISLTGAFVFGVAIVAAASIIAQISRLGPGPGLTLIVPELIGVGIFVLMFLRIFDEGLSE
jgi:protease PrsW